MMALKVTMIVFGVTVGLLGLGNIFMPDLGAEVLGFSGVNDLARWTMVILGVAWVSIGVWAIVAARDLMRQLIVVKLAITKSVLAVAGILYAILMGYAGFDQVWWGVVMDAVFAAALLVFYPYKAAKGG